MNQKENLEHIDSFVIKLEPEERYDRHHLIDWWDQNKLKNSKVLIAGAGALGNEVIKNLALVGVGNITIIDFDTVSITNLTRSVLFRESDVGLPKIEVARQKALEINPELNIQAINGDLEFDIGVGDVCQHDLILGCLDSVNARWAINQLAYRAGIPWVNGGIGISEGEVSFFDPSKETACYECTISSEQWKRRNHRFSCQGLKRDIPEQAMPTTATIASVVGAMQVQQALCYLHDREGLLFPGEKIFLGFTPWTNFKVKMPRQEFCLAHDLTIKPSTSFNYQPDMQIKSILQQLDKAGFSEPILRLRNEVIRFAQCINPDCNYPDMQINQPRRKYPVSKLICPQCSKERDLEVIRTISLEDVDDDMTLEKLSLLKNEILHCETIQGTIGVQFSIPNL